MCIVILAGLVIKYIINIDEPVKLPVTDYAEEDSLAGSSILSDKKVDYEQELLDFSENDLSPPKSTDDPLSGHKININTADSKTLSRLPGIGIKTAEKIIALRSRKQRFESVEELLEVKGIGNTKLNNIRKHITIE